jgi:hypothetical protein
MWHINIPKHWEIDLCVKIRPSTQSVSLVSRTFAMGKGYRTRERFKVEDVTRLPFVLATIRLRGQMALCVVVRDHQELGTTFKVISTVLDNFADI